MQFDSPNSIGLIVRVLHFKLWGKTPVGGRLRSELWWRINLHNLINGPTIDIAPENLWDGCQAQEAPIPYEVEMRLDATQDCGNILQSKT